MTPARRIKCRSHRATLDAVLDGRERLAALQSLELHAEDCAECARALEESRALRAALDALPGPEFDRSSDDAFVAGVLGRIDGAEATPMELPRRASAWRLVPVSLAAAAAITVYVLVDNGAPGSTHDVEVADGAEIDEPGPAVSAPQVPSVEPQASSDDLPPIVQEASIATSVDDLVAVLDSIAAEGGFDSRSARNAETFLHEVRGRVDGDLAAAARWVVLDAEGSVDSTELERAALAARLLGVTADYRDRDLLAQVIETIGAPAAFALADRGAPGIERLWELAAEEGNAARVARTALRELVVLGDPSRDPSRGVPRALPVGLVAPIVSASPESGAAHSLSRYVATGDDAWLEALLEHGRRDDAIADMLATGVRRRDRDRVLRLIARTGTERAVDFVGHCLEVGEPRAIDALAALEGDGPFELLVEFARTGRLPDEVEEGAWQALVLANAGHLVETAERWAVDVRHAGDVEIVLDALVRADVDARSLLVRLASLETVGSRARITALLHVAAKDEFTVPLSALDVRRLESLLTARDVDVAAAAWVVHGLDPAERSTAPPAIHAALERGGDPAVRLVRVSRALSRERARDERRAGRRAGATP